MYFLFWFIIGLVLGSLLILMGRRLSSKKEKDFLALSLLIAALVYIGFALISGSNYWLGIEGIGVLVYGTFAFLGYRYAAIWVGLGWLIHPLWDAVLHLYGAGHVIAPDWYTVACISFDVVVGVYILLNLSRYSNTTSTTLKKA